MEKTRIVLIGLGGFGNQYVNALLTNPYGFIFEIVGACDPRLEGCEKLSELQKLQVPIFDSPQSMFAQIQADFACIATPIFLHVEHALLAFQNGCDVLLEKPIAATAEETRKILDARDASGKHLAIGFQWCYDSAMQRFKRDIVAGRFGKLLSMQAMVLWPRDWAYYARGGGWAGKRFSADGRPLFDSVASNATAHYIMNMLWIAGESFSTAQPLSDSQVWTGRINDIETFDSIAFAGKAGDVQVHYCASHAVTPADTVNPMFRYVFEKGVCEYAQDVSEELTVVLQDGERVSYGTSIPSGTNMEKLWQVLSAKQKGNWFSLPCPGEAALAHAVSMDIISAVPVQNLSSTRREDTQRGAWVLPEMGDWLKGIYESGHIPQEYALKTHEDS